MQCRLNGYYPRMRPYRFKKVHTEWSNQDKSAMHKQNGYHSRMRAQNTDWMGLNPGEDHSKQKYWLNGRAGRRVRSANWMGLNPGWEGAGLRSHYEWIMIKDKSVMHILWMQVQNESTMVEALMWASPKGQFIMSGTFIRMLSKSMTRVRSEPKLAYHPIKVKSWSTHHHVGVMSDKL